MCSASSLAPGIAWNRGSVFEGIAIPIVLGTRAAPEFWLGMVLLSIFAFNLGWFPSGGANSPGSFYPSEWAPHDCRSTSCGIWRCRR